MGGGKGVMKLVRGEEGKERDITGLREESECKMGEELTIVSVEVNISIY